MVGFQASGFLISIVICSSLLLPELLSWLLSASVKLTYRRLQQDIQLVCPEQK